MIFWGIDEQTVEFRIVNYEFPENSGGDWDGNWLNIYLKVKSNFGDWEVTDPSLTTWDVRRLIKWFEELSKNIEQKWNLQEFTEPNISFELLNSYENEIKDIIIKFRLESRPKTASEDIDYFIEMLVDNKELLRIAEELKNELERFPGRRSTDRRNK